MFTSLEFNRSITLKARCYTRDNPSVPSLTGLYQGADIQEREIYDLMGIAFQGHPNLKRILLWEGFDGHPLRKDFNR
jgi:NADH:ubiquinone oxidoreductase subunit C